MLKLSVFYNKKLSNFINFSSVDQDGRLGLDLTLNRDDTNFVCSPRPIFGSLYLVGDVFKILEFDFL